MFRRDKSRNHANPTARTRRIREAERRERERIAAGSDPAAPYDRDQIRGWHFDDAEPAPAGASSPRARSTARRRPPIGRILLIGFVLLLAVAVIGGVLLWQRVSAFNDSVSTAPALSSSLWGPLGGEDRINIVLFGYGGSEHKSGNYLADSIQILSIDPKNDTTTMIPIPRDLWVEGLPELPDNAKINEAFADGYANDGGIPGGAAFATSVLARLTGLQLDHWMAIDFSGFEGMVDAVGGVTIRNPRAFQFTWNEWKFRHGVWDGGRFKRGFIDLDGTRALDYARARYTSIPQESSDFARSVRQQRVLGALRSKMGSGGISSLGPGLSMMDALDGRMMTDLSAIDLFLLSSHLSPDRRIELKEGRILEATTNTNGQYILVVIGRSGPTDYAPLQQYLATELAKPIKRHAPKATGS